MKKFPGVPWQKVRRWLCNELGWLADQLLAPHCLLCRQALTETSHGLCRSCALACQQQPPACCPCCSEPYSATSQANHRCSHCLKNPPPFRWLKAAGLYNEAMTEAIQHFKYHGQPGWARPLAHCIITGLNTEILAFQPQLIVAVPLHRTRLQKRGFNQSQLLAKQLAATYQLPLADDALLRTRATQPQSQLTVRQRHKNLGQAFTLGSSLAPQRILLVDDIVTTTATMRCCAALLVADGHQVAAVALARASQYR